MGSGVSPFVSPNTPIEHQSGCQSGCFVGVGVGVGVGGVCAGGRAGMRGRTGARGWPGSTFGGVGAFETGGAGFGDGGCFIGGAGERLRTGGLASARGR